MINAVAAIREYLLSFPSIKSDVTRGTSILLMRHPLQNGIVNGEGHKAITIQQINIVSDKEVPIDTARLRIRAYGPDINAAGQLMRDIHNKAFFSAVGGLPVTNVVIADRWFFFSVEAAGDGPQSVEQGVDLPFQMASYIFRFDATRE